MERKLALLLLIAGIASAQFPFPRSGGRSISARAGTVRLMQGDASIDGKPVRFTPYLGTPPQMHNGQTLHVDWGRVELRLGPGAGITLSEGSTLRLKENRLDDVQVELVGGSGLVKVDEVFKGGHIRLMYPEGGVELRALGWYRFDAKPQTLRVYRGEAEVAAGGLLVKAKKGQAVDLVAAPTAMVFNLKDSDPLIDQELAKMKDAEVNDRRANERMAMMRAKRGGLPQDRGFDMSSGPMQSLKPPQTPATSGENPQIPQTQQPVLHTASPGNQ